MTSPTISVTGKETLHWLNSMTRACLAVLLQNHSMWKDDNDEGVLLPTLCESPSYFKRIRDFTLAQNNSELLFDAGKWQEKLRSKVGL